jgi:hypothetical protein
MRSSRVMDEIWPNDGMRSRRVVWQSMPKSQLSWVWSDTVESEGRQMKQCRINTENISIHKSEKPTWRLIWLPDEVRTARTTHAAWPTPPLTVDCCTNSETDISWEKKIDIIQLSNELESKSGPKNKRLGAVSLFHWYEVPKGINLCDSFDKSSEVTWLLVNVMKRISSLLPFLPFSYYAADPGWLVMLLSTRNTSDRGTKSSSQSINQHHLHRLRYQHTLSHSNKFGCYKECARLKSNKNTNRDVVWTVSDI